MLVAADGVAISGVAVGACAMVTSGVHVCWSIPSRPGRQHASGSRRGGSVVLDQGWRGPLFGQGGQP